MARTALLPTLSALIGACSGTAPEPPPDFIAAVEGPEAEIQCLRAHCDGATDAEAFAACREQACAARDDAWQLVPTRIRHEGETLFVQAALAYEPGGYGDVETPRQTEAYVGVTAITSEGQEIDLAVTTVFPDTLEAPFILQSEVGPDVRDVIFGLWDHKVQPCDSERMGCQEYGFLLDGALATWPPDVYAEGVRQRVPPASLDVTVLDGGAGAELAPLRDAALLALTEQLGLFGSELGTVTTRVAPAPTEGRVVHADSHDVLLARRVAAALARSAAPPIAHDPAAVAPIVIEIPGEPAVHAATAGSCGEQVDAGYLACVSDLGAGAE